MDPLADASCGVTRTVLQEAPFRIRKIHRV
jgi:hypothetical protein